MHPLARHPSLDRPLRVGMLAPIAWRVPPRHYGPWERVVSLLTEGLVAAGAEVTLFATADSRTAACKAAIGPRLQARTLPGQQGEVTLAAAVLNRMIRTAKPASVRSA